MKVLAAVAIVLGILVGSDLPALAETSVNFSGTWELDRSRSVLPSRGPWALISALTLVIDHQGDTLRIERRAEIMRVPQSFVTTIYTDGREASNQTPRGETVVSKCHWEGNRLVTVHKGPTDSTSGTDTRYLAEEGKVLIVDSVLPPRSGGDNPERAHVVFVRK